MNRMIMIALLIILATVSCREGSDDRALRPFLQTVRSLEEKLDAEDAKIFREALNQYLGYQFESPVSLLAGDVPVYGHRLDGLDEVSLYAHVIQVRFRENEGNRALDVGPLDSLSSIAKKARSAAEAERIRLHEQRSHDIEKAKAEQRRALEDLRSTDSDWEEYQRWSTLDKALAAIEVLEWSVRNDERYIFHPDSHFTATVKNGAPFPIKEIGVSIHAAVDSGEVGRFLKSDRLKANEPIESMATGEMRATFAAVEEIHPDARLSFEVWSIIDEKGRRFRERDREDRVVELRMESIARARERAERRLSDAEAALTELDNDLEGGDQ